MWTLVYQPHSSIVWTFSCSNMFQHVPTFKAHSLVTKLFEPTAIKLCKIPTYPWPHRIPMKMPSGDVSERRIVSGLTGHDPCSLDAIGRGGERQQLFSVKKEIKPRFGKLWMSYAAKTPPVHEKWGFQEISWFLYQGGDIACFGR